MRRYESYKDSGVEWLGEVPSQWEVKKMKFLFKDTSIKNKPDATLLSVTQNRGVIPRNWLEERTVMPSGNLETFKFIQKDDFAISLRSFEGGLEICHHDGIISPAYTVLKYDKKFLNNGYYKYLFKCQKFISEMQTSIVGIREGKNISYEELKYSFLPIPQIIEQQKIAQFLDEKTAKIDQAVDLAEKQIALLKEHKQILIQNAVTRGLNPDVPLKDSGVEWIGQVPEHWEVKKMKFLFKDTSIKNKPDATLLSVTQNRGVIPRNWLEERTVMPSGNLETFKFIQKDDFAISLRSFEGGLEICHHDGIISPAYTVLKYDKKFLNNGYYKYLFKCQKFISEMQTSIVGIREGKNISYEELKYSFLPIPQIIEQQKIAQFLDEKTAKIDQAIALKTAHIEKLKEYKSVLINDVVTGKVRV